MGNVTKLIICGNNKQVEEVKSRLVSSIYPISVVNLLEDKDFQYAPDSMHDYCFVAADEMQSELLKKIVPKELVLDYYLFADTTYDYPCQQFFKTTTEKIEELLFGMSHSECGITDDYQNSHKCLKFSLPSLDLFLQSKAFQKLCLHHGKNFSDVKKVVIELPYYIFNYDLSRFGLFVLSKLNYFKQVGDYHHFGETEKQKKLIQQFELFMEFFKQKEQEKEKVKRRNIIRKTLNYVSFVARSQWQALRNKDSVWKKIHKETIEENTTYWQQLIKSIQTYCPQAQIVVMVMPFNPMFRWTHKKDIEILKHIFYDIMKKSPDISVVDNFCVYCNMFLFEDHCHLNKRGAKLYTSMILK